MSYDLSYLSVPLPEDVVKLKNFGDFRGAEELINRLIITEIPTVLKKRLELERNILQIIGLNEYPFTYQQANQMMKETFYDYQERELANLKATGQVDWIYIDGRVHFQRRFLMNLIKVNQNYIKRVIQKQENSIDQLRKMELTENVTKMKQKGCRKAKIVLKASIQVKKEYERVGEKVRVHLPIPRSCQQISKINILKTTPKATCIASEKEEQRTICFETVLRPNQIFSVEYSYENQVEYVDLMNDNYTGIVGKKKYESNDLTEQFPHIRFTPYLQLLLIELLASESNQVKKARKIYDFVTTKIDYTFMREYITVENISEYAAVNLKGDCGVQAILFITLCRMADIPARWQSGLYVSQYYTGCHDWAQFYLEPYGWLFADLSFGGSAYREGDLERWNYYFGNLDIYRMPANSGIQSTFMPNKKHLRADPIDNQRGEFEYEDVGLPYALLEVRQELISMEELI